MLLVVIGATFFLPSFGARPERLQQLVNILAPESGSSKKSSGADCPEGSAEDDCDGDWSGEGLRGDTSQVEKDLKFIETWNPWNVTLSDDGWDSGGAEAWVPGCYQGDDHEHTLKLGIVADYSVYLKWGGEKGVSKLTEKIKWMVSKVSYTIERQMGIKLEIGHLDFFKTSSDPGQPCPKSLEEQDKILADFKLHKDKRVADGTWADQGVFFMLTTCPYWYGAMGKALGLGGGDHVEYGRTYWRSACTDRGVAVTLFPPAKDKLPKRTPWSIVDRGVPLVFLQELGLTLGAVHGYKHFVNQTGAKGGAMATGLDAPWHLNNVLQFNTHFRKGESCNYLERMVSTCPITKFEPSSRPLKYRAPKPGELSELVGGCSDASDVPLSVMRDQTLLAGQTVCCDYSGSAIRAFDGECANEGKLGSFHDAQAFCKARNTRLCRSQEEVDTACGEETCPKVDSRFVWIEEDRRSLLENRLDSLQEKLVKAKKGTRRQALLEKIAHVNMKLTRLTLRERLFTLRRNLVKAKTDKRKKRLQAKIAKVNEKLGEFGSGDDDRSDDDEDPHDSDEDRSDDGEGRLLKASDQGAPGKSDGIAFRASSIRQAAWLSVVLAIASALFGT